MNKEICTNIENLYCSSIYPDCPKKHLCDNGLHNFSKRPKMPYIGRDYGNNSKIPNLLFISLDSGDEYENYHTVEEIRNGVETNPPRENPGKDKVKHWYQTFDIATIFINKYLDESVKKGVSYADSFVAHTNSAKCTQNKEKRKIADANLFENCRGFVVKEIPLFDADVIITQGNPAKYCLNTYTIIKKIDLETIHNGNDIIFPIYIRETNNKKILHIPMYHPSYFKGYRGQKKAFKDNLDTIYKIVEEIRN